MNSYKFRAECQSDVEALKANLQNFGTFHLSTTQMQIDGIPIPDVEAELELNSDIDRVLNAMRSIPDSHVMIQTLEIAENYTGERDYDRR
jgi:hypothetical protein